MVSLTQSPDIKQNSDEGLSDFRISSQSLIKINCHNYRTSKDIDIEFGPVTKLDKRDKAISKNIDSGVMLVNWDAAVFFSNSWPICGNPEARFRMHSLQNLSFY